jgi:hypothetical protein
MTSDEIISTLKAAQNRTFLFNFGQNSDPNADIKPEYLTTTSVALTFVEDFGGQGAVTRIIIEEPTAQVLGASVSPPRPAGLLSTNPRMRARDPVAIGLMRATRSDHYREGRLATKDAWLPTVERLRPMFP